MADTGSTPTPDLLIIGAGVIGLTIAWQAARRGMSVTVLDCGTAGSGASGAAAGMLAPFAESPGPGAFVELGLASLRIYPEFIATLEAESGASVEPRSPGLLRLAFSPVEAEGLTRACEWQRKANLPFELLTREDALRLEPGINPALEAALLSPCERQVDPRRLITALQRACTKLGVVLREQVAVTGIELRAGTVRSVETQHGNVHANQFVVAAGAWSATLGKLLGCTIPVRPVKGQIVSLIGVTQVVRHTLYSHTGYVVPRGGNRVIIGATAEEAGFDIRPTAGGIKKLLTTAESLLPNLADAAFDTAWAGLRPASADGLPILGPAPGLSNVWIAAGHFRNGILLAPITGELVVAGLCGKMDKEMLHPFRPERFQEAAAR